MSDPIIKIQNMNKCFGDLILVISIAYIVASIIIKIWQR